MKRHAPTSPGGPLQSALKKSRLSALAQQQRQTQAQQPSTGIRRPTVSDTPRAAGQTSNAVGATVDAQAAATGASSAPYHVLDASVASGPLARAWGQAQAQPTSLAGLTSRDAGTSGSGVRGSTPGGRRPHRGTAQPLAGAGAASGGAMERLTDLLLATNPAFAGRPAEVRAAAGLRVRDRSLLLDNPPAPPKTAAQRAEGERTGSAASLRPLRGAGREALLQRGSLKYAQVQPLLHTAWQKYMANLLASTTQQAAAGAPSTAQQDARALHQFLLSADLHGCMVHVKACPNPLHAGRRGMVVQVTSTALLVLDEEDRLHVVPKAGCCVSFDLPDGRQVQAHLDSFTCPQQTQPRRKKRHKHQEFKSTS